MAENLDLVRSIYADWERGDLTSSQWAHPDIEYVAHGAFAEPAPERFAGRAVMGEAARMFLSVWDEWTIVAEDMRELDDGRVLVLNRYSARGKLSGVTAEQLAAHGAHIFLVRHRQIAQLTVYARRAQALADLGLEE